VAYKQPVSRAQVASIRGVDPDGVLRTLQARGYVDHIGRDPGPGQAMLWGTTTMFLEKLGLDSLSQLPPLHDFVPGADVVEALEQGLRIAPIDMPEPSPREPVPAPAPPPADFIGATSYVATDDPAEDDADDDDDDHDDDDDEDVADNEDEDDADDDDDEGSADATPEP
jgi:segregation and condensation protein B